MENLNCKIYEEENNGSWNLKVEHENVNTITASGGNIVVVLAEEDYMGKFVYLYDSKKYRAIIEAL